MELVQPHYQPYVVKTRHSNLIVQPYKYSPFSAGKMPEPIQSPDSQSCLLRDIFTTILKEYKTDKIRAGNKLYKIYLLASDRGTKDISSSLGFSLSQEVYNCIGISQALQHNYPTAIEFTKKAHPNDDTALTNRGLYLTKLAQQTTDPILKDQYYKEAFVCFKEAAPFDYIAHKRYFHALTNGIGCTSQEISNHFNQNIKHNTRNEERIAAIKNFELVAKKGNMSAQCILATAYYGGINGLSKSAEKSLLMCRYYLQSVAQCPKIEELPIQRFIFDRIIKDLSASNEKKIADQALMFARYMDLFMANITGNQQKIESLTSKKPLEKLLCKNYTKSSAYIQEIKKMTPAELRNISELEKSILKDLVVSILDNSTEQANAIHYLCGIIAYNDKNYKKAYHHLSQCPTHAKNDLLTNYLMLESHYRMQKKDDVAIQKNLDLMMHINNLLLKRAGNNQKLKDRDASAQQKIIALYQEIHKSYEAILLENEHYNLAYQLIGHLLPHKQTIDQALLMLLTIEQKINAQDQHLNETIDPQLRNDIDHKVDALNHKNISVETMLTVVEFLRLKATRPSLSSQHTSKYLKQALEYLPCHTRYKNPITAESSKKLREILLVTIGKLEASIPHLDEAIALGSLDALCEKIHILLAIPTKTPAEMDELVKLMTKKATSDHPERCDALNGIAYYYYKNSLDSSNMEDRKKAFDYFFQAIAAGDSTYAYLLGSLYLHGIPKYVEADAEKALYYFNKQTVFNENISHNHLIAMKCHAYYKQEKYQEILDLLLPNTPTEITELRAEFLWLTGMAKMQLFNANILDTEVINCCVEAYTIFQQCPHEKLAPIETIQCITDEKFLKIAEHKTAYILLTNNKTPQTLEFCNIIGQLLWRETEEKPLTDERRKAAIKYIQYAADNNNANAQEFAVYTDNQEISPSDKIYYLECAHVQRMQENSAKAQTIQKLLDEIYPATLDQQAILISHYIEKNNIPLLQKYMEQLYTAHSPLITLETSQETEKGFIKTCYGNEFMKQAAQNFIQNPAQATLLEKYVAIFLGSLLAYSFVQKELLQAIRYLENVRLVSAKQNETIKENKSTVYYKLGCLAIAPYNPRPNAQLATKYYERSADLGNMLAQIELCKLVGIKVSLIPKPTVKNNVRSKKGNNRK